ncbi:uncharacterized protein J3D65DRAFT_393522 [Phyllosticta citribraziliensis]|uniref:Secreted protein n=1 Tax=Phyllosticta citribraziliensis TaxID=989973 RepID=A0ABR1LMC5_9PEZI
MYIASFACVVWGLHCRVYWGRSKGGLGLPTRTYREAARPGAQCGVLWRRPSVRCGRAFGVCSQQQQQQQQWDAVCRSLIQRVAVTGNEEMVLSVWRVWLFANGPLDLYSGRRRIHPIINTTHSVLSSTYPTHQTTTLPPSSPHHTGSASQAARSASAIWGGAKTAAGSLGCSCASGTPITRPRRTRRTGRPFVRPP